MKDFLYHFLVPFVFSIIAPLVMVAAGCIALMGAGYVTIYFFLFMVKIFEFLWSIVF